MKLPRHPTLLLVLLAMAIHVAALAPLAGSDSFILDHVFGPDAEAIASGSAPYSELGFEYPPGAVPIVALPALVAGTGEPFRIAFGSWMLLWDLAAVALIGVAFRGRPRELAGALTIYTVGIITLGRLSLARFDLVPATLALAAIVLRDRGRSLGWGLALGAGLATKIWPGAILPPLLVGERRKLLAIVGAVAVPLLITAIVWGLTGDDPQSAFNYHSDRDLQVESVIATPLLVGDQLGGNERVIFGSGSFNLAGHTASVLRDITPYLELIGYLLLALWLIGRRCQPLLVATALTAWLVIAAPVLSPQFLIWLLPLAALALARRYEALLLLVAVALTRVGLEHADQTVSLGPGFVWATAFRNLTLVVWFLLLVRLALATRLSTSTPSSEKIIL